MFPSPIGELHFSILRDSAKKTYDTVSVPYRGATFLNSVGLSDNPSANTFPSPIGELHFSIYKNPRRNNVERFPSPIGELHFSINDIIIFKLYSSIVSVPYRGATFLNNQTVVVKYNHQQFPSPIGELHFSIPSPQPHVLSGTNRGIAGEK